MRRLIDEVENYKENPELYEKILHTYAVEWSGGERKENY